MRSDDFEPFRTSSIRTMKSVTIRRPGPSWVEGKTDSTVASTIKGEKLMKASRSAGSGPSTENRSTCAKETEETRSAARIKKRKVTMRNIIADCISKLAVGKRKTMAACTR